MAGMLAALGNSVRLAIVRELARTGDRTCDSIELGVTKATATHHWRILREAGLVRQWRVGRRHYVALRTSEVEARFPGLLDTVLRVPAAPLRQSSPH